MGRTIHGCSHPPRSASLTQGDQEVSNWLCFFSRWLIDGLFVNAILMVGWIPTEICLMGMAGSSAELWSICRGAVVGRAEMHVAPGDGWVCTLGGGGFSGFAMAVSCFFLLFLFAFLPSAWRRLKGLLWNPAVLMNCIKPGKAKEPFQRKQKCMCRPIFAYLGLQKAGLCRVVFSSSNKRLYPNCTDLFTMLDLVTLPTDFYNSSNSFIGVRRFV